MADVKISDEVADVLRRSRAYGEMVYLPPGQLPRPLYEAVNKALMMAGGKWNRGKQAHVFPSDARMLLDGMLGSGVSVDLKKKRQAFYTPPEVAARLVALADVKGRSVLEPSAGGGALCRAANEAGARSLKCYELDELAAAKLGDGGFDVECKDFLQVLPHESRMVERVVMNPPFTKNQDIQHVAHAMKFLELGGALTAIMAPNQDRKGFQALLDQYTSSIEELPAGAFKTAGTSIATIIVKLIK